MSQKGILITFEGGEGSGKSTVVAAVEALLKARDLDVLATRDPGGSPMAASIRELLFSSGKDIDPSTTSLLFTAARASLIHDTILPALSEGKIVLCDRFTDSARVYQALALGKNPRIIDQLNDAIVPNTIPTLTILLDVNPSIAMVRRGKAGIKNWYDEKPMLFHHRVRGGYKTLANRYSARIKIVDGGQPIDTVAQEALALIDLALIDLDEPRFNTQVQTVLKGGENNE